MCSKTTLRQLGLAHLGHAHFLVDLNGEMPKPGASSLSVSGLVRTKDRKRGRLQARLCVRCKHVEEREWDDRVKKAEVEET